MFVGPSWTAADRLYTSPVDADLEELSNAMSSKCLSVFLLVATVGPTVER